MSEWTPQPLAAPPYSLTSNYIFNIEEIEEHSFPLISTDETEKETALAAYEFKA